MNSLRGSFRDDSHSGQCFELKFKRCWSNINRLKNMPVRQKSLPKMQMDPMMKNENWAIRSASQKNKKKKQLWHYKFCDWLGIWTAIVFTLPICARSQLNLYTFDSFFICYLTLFKIQIAWRDCAFNCGCGLLKCIWNGLGMFLFWICTKRLCFQLKCKLF